MAQHRQIITSPPNLNATLLMMLLVFSPAAATRKRGSNNDTLVLRNSDSDHGILTNDRAATALTQPLHGTNITAPSTTRKHHQNGRKKPNVPLSRNEQPTISNEPLEPLHKGNNNLTGTDYVDLETGSKETINSPKNETPVVNQNQTFPQTFSTAASVNATLVPSTVRTKDDDDEPFNISSTKFSVPVIGKNESILAEKVLSPPTTNVAAMESMTPVESVASLQIMTEPHSSNESTNVQQPIVSLAPSSSQINVVTKPEVVPLPEFQLIQDCGCQRKLFYKSQVPVDSKLNSSCSDEGTHYYSGQKVVSFSLPRATSPGDYNRTESYKVNVMENLRRIRHFYPGYSMRIYTDLSLDSTYCRFLCLNMDLFWCDIRNSIGDQSKMLHPTWKFLPLGDPSVELFLSRDIATFISDREAAAVHDWLTLNKTFHVMRDKRRVHNIAMMGGLWGARNDLLVADEGDKLRAQIISMSKTPRNKGYRVKNFDQDILSRVIFYPRKKDIVAYDSYHCKQWKKFTMIRPFPIRRNNTLAVAGPTAVRGAASSAVAAIKKKYKLYKCPVECRPSYGKDWEYC